MDSAIMSEVPNQPTQSKSPWQQPKSPWGQTQPIKPCSLSDVMSEELASKLQQDQEEKLSKRLAQLAPVVVEPKTAETACAPQIEADQLLTSTGTDETCDDYKIALLLQQQFDKEHNTMISKEAQKLNGQSRVSISFNNYKVSHTQPDDVDLDSDEDDDDDDDDNDVIEVTKSPWKKYQFNKGGLTLDGTEVKSKHDAVLCGRRNAEKILAQLPPDFDCGDAEKMDLKLSNQVYNKLRHHSLITNKSHMRVTEKQDHATANQVVDPRTRILLFKLVNAGILESVTGAISAGKEAAVFHAYGGSVDGVELPPECAIKIYKTTLNEFKNRQDYVVGDHRFSKDDYKKWNPRKILRIWAEKETANLNRMRKFNVPCPRVVSLKKHLLVMSFIGSEGQPAPKLNDIKLGVEDIQDAYEQTLNIMKVLHKDCCLIHADLSEFNLLWHEGTVYVIDVSQAVDLTHPKAFEFLYRDCKNISKFFSKEGVANVMNAEDMFNDITGWQVKGQGVDFLSQMRRYEKETNEANLMMENRFNKKEYPFDYYFELSQKTEDKSDSEEEEEQ